MASGLEALQKGIALLEAGSFAGAVEAFKLAGEGGVAEGYVELARVEIERGDHEAAHEYMRKAETLAEQGDAVANLSCSLAYQLAYGEGSLEQLEEKARYFLRRAAELGNPIAQSMLAQQLLWGLNGEVQDEHQYEKWIWRAIEQGLDEAVINHVRNMQDLKRDIEPRLVTKLEELAARSEQARKLLRQAAP